MDWFLVNQRLREQISFRGLREVRSGAKFFFTFLFQDFVKTFKISFYRRRLRKYLLTKDAEFSKKLTFLTHSYPHEYVWIKG